MRTPLVLVPADVKPLRGLAWHASAGTYLAALVRVAGCTPLVLPAFGAELDLEAALDAVDGVMLPGSRSNVHPSVYGVPPDAAYEPYDPARDATSLPLIRSALRRGMPLLAICRGMQELNVALGGTLRTEIQDEPDHWDHRAPETEDLDLAFGIRQSVQVRAGGVLAGIVRSGEILVNSLHRQGVARLADGLETEAVAADGTVEAVSVREARGFALGLQWHPEYWAATDAPSTAIFATFAEAVRVYAAKRARASAA